MRRIVVNSVRYVCLGFLLILAAAGVTAGATEFKTLYEFGDKGLDGSGPMAGLVTDSAGNFYGTTVGGGVDCPKKCNGVVFKLATSGTETVLHSFEGSHDGSHPEAPLVANQAGNYFGTAVDGALGHGSIYEITPTGDETVLYMFGKSGEFPHSGLLIDKSGNLYGTTTLGGVSGCGVVFELTSAGKEKTLYSFSCGSDGKSPSAGLIADSSGNLYGTTQGGGSKCCGVVFKLSPDGAETVLYSFTGGSDGEMPVAPVIMDKSGNLYGTTIYGGACESCGVVFKLAPDGTETVLHAFSGANDGCQPAAGLLADQNGNLYGTTLVGGDATCECCGIIYKIAPNGKEKILHAFSGSDGALPYSQLIADQSGNLYGTTYEGDDNNLGTIFRVHE